jgi:hypothetical protein
MIADAKLPVGKRLERRGDELEVVGRHGTLWTRDEQHAAVHLSHGDFLLR